MAGVGRASAGAGRARARSTPRARYSHTRATIPKPNRTKTAARVTTCTPDGALDFSGPARARVRGGTNTQRFNRILAYAITDFGGRGAGLKKAAKKGGGGGGAGDGGAPAPRGSAALLGMPSGRHFILLGQQNDTFGVKGWAGLELARAMPALEGGDGAPPLRWTPRARHVELFLVDGAHGAMLSRADYRGVYLLSEHIEPGPERVRLGARGALATFLHGEPDPEGTQVWGPVTGKPWMIKYPTAARNAAAGNATAAGAAATLAGFERGLYSPALAWRDWADEAAAIDWFLLTELTKANGRGRERGARGGGGGAARAHASPRRPPSTPTTRPLSGTSPTLLARKASANS